MELSRFRNIFRPGWVRNRIELEIKQKKIRDYYLREVKNNIDLFNEIRYALLHFHEGGGYQREKQDYKVYQLYTILKKISPSKSIEFGSGSSTFAFAKYANESDNFEHWVVEESEKWLRNTKTTIERTGLPVDTLHWVKGDKEIKRGKERAEIGVKQKFEENFDLVFIDGPTLKVNDIQDSKHINTDIFRIYDHHPPKCIVVDIRKHTVSEIEKRIGEKYELEESHLFDLLQKPVHDQFNYFSVFTRKDVASEYRHS